MWPCPERRVVTMGCLYLEIECQSRSVGSVDQGLMKKKNRQIDVLDRMTQKIAEKSQNKKQYCHFSPITTLPGIFQQMTPEKVWKLFGQTLSFPLPSVWQTPYQKLKFRWTTQFAKVEFQPFNRSYSQLTLFTFKNTEMTWWRKKKKNVRPFVRPSERRSCFAVHTLFF